MLAESAHVQHDKFRPAKNLGIYPLKDKVFFFFGFQGYQKGVIDIAIAIFFYSNDLTLWFKLVCDGDEIIQGFASDWLDAAVSKFPDFGGQVGCA